jgi:hypothetical protein
MSAIPQAIIPKPHTNLLNVYIQIANKMWFKKPVFLNCCSTLSLTQKDQLTFSV